MATKTQERQRFYHYYKEQTGAKEVDMKDVARFAQKMGWALPVPPDPLDVLAKQFSEAVGEETRDDKQTKRRYKANLAIKKRLRDGTQLTLFVDVDEALRLQMVNGLYLYREQMVGEALMGTNTADHWNRVHPDQQPLEFPTDFTDDVNYRRNAPDEDQEAS